MDTIEATSLSTANTRSLRRPGTALITGASSGIGMVYANRLARRGHDLILVARDQPRLDELAATLRAANGVKAEVLRADLTHKPDLILVEQRLHDDPAISMLVNNAGMAVVGPLGGADADHVETMIRVNVVAVTRLATAALPAFISRGEGTVVNIASVVALAPELFSGAYSASKAFVLNLTLSLHQELGNSGVRVQAVLPGATRTDIWRRAGIDLATLDPEILMDVEEMVDAGLDHGEAITIPSLEDTTSWDQFTASRLALGPHLSRKHAAARYRTDSSTQNTAPAALV